MPIGTPPKSETGPGKGRRTSPAWLPVLVLAASTVALTVTAAEPRREDRMAAVFPPWWSAAAAAGAAASAGDLSAAGGWNNVLIVHSDSPGLGRRLLASGALLLVDANLARTCFGSTPQGNRT